MSRSVSRGTALGAAALLAPLALLAGCGDSGPGSSGAGVRRVGPEAPERASASLLFVSLDTYRADAAGCGGNPAARTPQLDRLARQGVQLEGLAATPVTAPSHASMLTGLDPPAHGVRDNGTFRVPAAVPTLAEALRTRGFRTAAFISAFPLARRFGFDRGFDRYDDEVTAGADGSMVIAQRAGTAVAAAARAEWAIQAPARRFTWVHLFDAHTPHDAPAPLVRATGDDYLADVALADRALGAVLRDAQAQAGPHWVIVLGDHGESRGDHREATHGLVLYGATIRVPAVVWPAPGGVPRVSRRPFRLVDLPATSFDLLGMDPGEAPGGGVSILRGSPPPAYAEARYAYYHFGWAPLASLQDGDWKYVSAPEPELYDLATDPGERDNVVAAEPDRAEDLAARLAARAAATGVTESTPLDDESRRALEALGYITATDARDDLPDPKRMLGVVQALERVQALVGAGRPDAALQPLRRALALDPRNKDVHQTFGIVYTALGRHAEAADSFRRALELPPHRNDRVPRFELASSLLRIGKPDEAAAELERIIADEPDDADVWYNLGVARQQSGDNPGATEAFRRALRENPDHALARQALGGRRRP